MQCASKKNITRLMHFLKDVDAHVIRQLTVADIFVEILQKYLAKYQSF